MSLLDPKKSVKMFFYNSWNMTHWEIKTGHLIFFSLGHISFEEQSRELITYKWLINLKACTEQISAHAQKCQAYLEQKKKNLVLIAEPYQQTRAFSITAFLVCSVITPTDVCQAGWHADFPELDQ